MINFTVFFNYRVLLWEYKGGLVGYTNDFKAWVNAQRKIKGWTWQDLATKLHQAGYKKEAPEMSYRYLSALLSKDTHPAELNAYIRHVLTGQPIIGQINSVDGGNGFNNQIIKKLSVALKLNESSVKELVNKGGLDITKNKAKGYLQAVYHKNHKPASDGVVLALLDGLIEEMRGKN